MLRLQLQGLGVEGRRVYSLVLRREGGMGHWDYYKGPWGTIIGIHSPFLSKSQRV